MRLVHTEAKKANRTFLKGAFNFRKHLHLRNQLTQRSDRRINEGDNVTFSKPIRKRRIRTKN